MQANYVQRMRLGFGKVGPARYIGHLDLVRTLERAFIRARIPLAYTQGYNRRPRMQLADALPLGITSECELADIWLKEKLKPKRIQDALATKMAPGIVLHHVKEIELSEPPLQTVTESAVFLIAVDDQLQPAVLQQRIDDLLIQNSLWMERHGKQYDLRPLIWELSITGGDGEPQLILAHLSLMPGKTGRPDQVLEALQLDPLSARIHRKELVLTDEPLTV